MSGGHPGYAGPMRHLTALLALLALCALSLCALSCRPSLQNDDADAATDEAEGKEIGRVEVPSWVAADEGSLGLAHALVVDQCRRGRGYPVGLMEAHEQAVIGGHEREMFRQMVEDALERQHLPVYTSEKARSKRLRWV